MLPRKPRSPSCGPTITAVGVPMVRSSLIWPDVTVARKLEEPARSVKIERTPMADQIRKYRMTRRAESQLETRRRITESAVILHGTLGPARTTMSAVAAHAG